MKIICLVGLFIIIDFNLFMIFIISTLPFKCLVSNVLMFLLTNLCEQIYSKNGLQCHMIFRNLSNKYADLVLRNISYHYYIITS